MVYCLGTLPKGTNIIMEIGKLIKKYLCVACVCFTLITAVYMIIMAIAYPKEEAFVKAYEVVLFFVFSILFAAANAVLTIEKINGPLRYFIHYVICAFAFYTCVLLPRSENSVNPSSFAIIGVVFFTLIYVIVMVIIAAFRSRLRKNREVSAAYTSQFKKKK